MTRLTLVPAYGRDYKSKAEVQAAWNAGKDFEVIGFDRGGCVNKDDCPSGSHNVRYKRLTAVMVLTVATKKSGTV